MYVYVYIHIYIYIYRERERERELRSLKMPEVHRTEAGSEQGPAAPENPLPAELRTNTWPAPLSLSLSPR